MSGVIPGLRRLINLMMEGLISFSIFIMGAYHSYLQKCTPLDKNVITKVCNNTSLVIVVHSITWCLSYFLYVSIMFLESLVLFLRLKHVKHLSLTLRRDLYWQVAILLLISGGSVFVDPLRLL